MTIPTDTVIAKLRIQIRRLQPLIDMEQAKVDLAYQGLRKIEEERNELYCQFNARAKTLGYCGVCELPFEGCMKTKCLGHAGLA